MALVAPTAHAVLVASVRNEYKGDEWISVIDLLVTTSLVRPFYKM